jgi:Family of unknown function (DUF6459)
MSGTAADLTLHGTRSFEPPYDDEPGGEPILMTTGSLALALSLGPRGGEAPALRLVTGGRKTARRPKPKASPVPPEAVDDEPPVEPTPIGPRTPRSALPPPRIFGARLVQSLVEATAGERPLAQLSPYLSRTVYHRLERYFAGTVRGSGQVGQDNRSSIRSVRVFEPADGVAELAAVVRRGGRMAAIALRLEGVDGRWQCTALQIG